MILSRKWLADYIDIDISDKQFCDEMTLSGSKVESFEQEGEILQNIVIGKVNTLEKHPDSDHLWICSIDVGSAEPIQIVTGAQNLKEADIVPVALDHSVIASGQKIKKGKLRGVPSNGMLCSLGELGLTIHDFPYATDDGIFVLGDDCDLTLGTKLQDAIGLTGSIIDFEITPNRPDCLSVLGLAREVAATFEVKFEQPQPQVKAWQGDVNDQLSVKIDDSENCYRYAGAVVENVRVGPSPRWMRERLRASGVRCINNIVDITNYVMLEYGQPMHAFDLRYLKGNTVNVRMAKEGETITTLDGTNRNLTTNMLVIADCENPVAVAGVMGGEFSGIMDDTTTIVFESACFNGTSVRTTSKALGLRTEASGRYEKGLDPANCMPALKRALELVQQLDAGDVVNGIVDCNQATEKAVVLDFNVDWINSFIGISLTPDKMQQILERLAFKVENGKIFVPSFRADVEHLADISEEIARFFGYANIPNEALRGTANGKLTTKQSFEAHISSVLLSCGASEIMTYSFISPKAYDKLALPKDSAQRNSVVITNPLGEDTSIMRTTALSSMLEVLARNYNNRMLELCLFENATVYAPTSPDTLPNESQKLVVGLYGADSDFYTLKGIIEELLSSIGIAAYDTLPITSKPTFHPGRCAQFIVGDCVLATFGEVHPAVSETYGIGIRAYLAEIDVNALFVSKAGTTLYQPLPRFPATNRDLAFVCDSNLAVLTLQKAIGAAIGEILESIKLFDVYQGEQIEAGKKSVAFNIRMRSAQRTLTDEEADSAMKRAIKALGELGICLRA